VIAMAKEDEWIQKALKHYGALKRWLKENHLELLKSDGTIAWTKLRE
jgi:hypothetical protein